MAKAMLSASDTSIYEQARYYVFPCFSFPVCKNRLVSAALHTGETIKPDEQRPRGARGWRTPTLTGYRPRCP